MKFVLGTMRLAGRFNGLYCSSPSRHAKAILGVAQEVGINTFDTAPLYGLGNSESFLGEHLGSSELIWTKVGVTVGKGLPKVDFSFDKMHAQLTTSLSRLRRPNADAVFFHNPWPQICRRSHLRRFAAHAKKLRLTTHVGMTVVDEYCLRFALDQEWIDFASVEYPALVELKSAETERVIVRGLFSSGKDFAGKSRKQAKLLVRRRIHEMHERGISQIIIEPRTISQLRDYLP